MMSIEILRRNGLRKPSNILLLGMVVADSMVQLTTMNFAETLSFFGPNYRYPKLCGWQYGTGVNYFLMACDALFLFLGNWGLYVNTTIPIIITVERFLAVYLPLTFKKIVTARSALASVIVAFIFWLPWNLFFLSLFQVWYTVPGVMFFSLGFLRGNQLEIFDFLNIYVFEYLSSWVPMAIIGVGCVLIGVKVKVTLSRRKKMTSSHEKVAWSAKTTRTLLITCLFLFISLIISFAIDYHLEFIADSDYYVVMECMRLNILINSSTNFFVYVTSNRKLASIFIDIIRMKKSRNLR